MDANVTIATLSISFLLLKVSVENGYSEKAESINQKKRSRRSCIRDLPDLLGEIYQTTAIDFAEAGQVSFIALHLPE